MSHSPAFQFYAADFLADENVVSMSLAGRGAYITLICFCWREGSIPSDLNRLARLCGTDGSAMAQLWDEICLCFETSTADPSRLVHPRLEKERQKQVAHRKERSETGKKGAEQRWGKAETQPSQQNSKTKRVKKLSHSSAIAQPMANDSSSSSTSTSISSDTNVSGDKSPPPKSSQSGSPAQLKAISPIWQIGLQLLTANGDSDAHARSFLGGLCKEYGNDPVAQAVASAAAAVPVDPKAYLKKILQQGGKSSGNGKHQPNRGTDRNAEILRERDYDEIDRIQAQRRADSAPD